MACAVVAAHGATPIDRSLPWIAIIIAIVAASAQEMNVFCAVPLLVAAEVTIPDERLRLLVFGVVVTAAFVFAAAREINLPLVAAGVLLLRWIPLQQISLWRELAILGGTLLLFVAMRSRSAVALTIALAVALVTPAVPTRMVLYPSVVAALTFVPNPLVAAVLIVCGAFARYSTAPLWLLAAAATLVPYARTKIVAVPVIVVGIVILILFPWSGVVARAIPLPMSLAPRTAETPRPVGVALAANQSYTIDLPANAKSVVIAISGANVSSIQPGTLVGRVNDRPIRIGDIADFGFMRPEHFHASRNRLPRHPVIDIRDFGQRAWLYGAGRITIPHPGGALRVVAAPSLPAAARLEIESVETR